jgi:hypothetical protein
MAFIILRLSFHLILSSTANHATAGTSIINQKEVGGSEGRITQSKIADGMNTSINFKISFIFFFVAYLFHLSTP